MSELPHYMSGPLRRNPKAYRDSDGKAINECAADELDRLTGILQRAHDILRRPDHAEQFTAGDLNQAWADLRKVIGEMRVLPGKDAPEPEPPNDQ